MFGPVASAGLVPLVPFAPCIRGGESVETPFCAADRAEKRVAVRLASARRRSASATKTLSSIRSPTKTRIAVSTSTESRASVGDHPPFAELLLGAYSEYTSDESIAKVSSVSSEKENESPPRFASTSCLQNPGVPLPATYASLVR